ncbi:MAG: hypothetical protein FJ395_21335 [Verrucomicrobia bacterium]|nr:hypothetical protein [Verrucomicrobiota bacterium]
MNPNRNTEGFTALTYLNWIQRGSTEDWKCLYRLCQDLSVAQVVAAILPLRDPDLMASARLWKHLLEDLHPGLQIDLKPHQRGVGV